MKMKPADHKIYLASKSPRRRELLRQINVDFELLLLRDRIPAGPEVNETVLPGEQACDYVARVTSDKAFFAQKTMMWRKLPIRPILAADTTVVLDDRIFGKPLNRMEAVEMISALSGRTHQVMTSVAVLHHDDAWQITQSSNVTFTELSPEMVTAYCATSEPYDKAGGYAVQGLASIFIREIVGSYSGIMGLPLYETSQLLQRAGLRIL
jgi:septum formation protein